MSFILIQCLCCHQPHQSYLAQENYLEVICIVRIAKKISCYIIVQIKKRDNSAKIWRGNICWYFATVWIVQRKHLCVTNSKLYLLMLNGSGGTWKENPFPKYKCSKRCKAVPFLTYMDLCMYLFCIWTCVTCTEKCKHFRIAFCLVRRPNYQNLLLISEKCQYCQFFARWERKSAL